MSFLGLKNPFRTGAGSVTDAATSAAASRQGRASNLTSQINSVFDDPNREQRTQDFMGALRTQLGDTTARGFANTARNTKFATARQGLTGGRVDVDRQRLNLEDLFRRQIADEGQVQDAGTALRTQDLGTRQDLINSAYGAADVGQSATRDMLGQQQKNSQYISSLLPQLVSSTGGDLANAYSRRAEMQAYLRGLNPGTPGTTPPLYSWNVPSFGGGYANG